MRRGPVLVIMLIAGCGFYAPRNDVGAGYLGAKYILDPLGEADGYDSDPLVRYDAFDCTTFVETVLADGDERRLSAIRYRDGLVAWENRNHFIETDWLSNNSDFLENASAKYGETAIRHVVIDKAAWALKNHGVSVNANPVAIELEYLPYETLGDIHNTRPLVVLFIVGNLKKHDKIATDIAVVHMGFLLPGGQVLRHASTGRGVVDDNFAEYVTKRRGMKNNIGIALVEIK